ncbi:hypothetical protein [Melittangium boletus]|uniref:hypothetical protein n=1 Tax=Melittangium boletus TaxID=83453 RepID=UPI003DA5A1FD
MRDGHVWVNGPWEAIRPSKSLDDVIDQLCPAIMELPQANWREHGQEYCGILYGMEDGLYYASHPSPLSPTVIVGSDKKKRCRVPNHVEDSRGSPSAEADFHSHPWATSPMSQEDRQARTQRWAVRIQFDTTCRTMKLIPYRHENRPGEVYLRQGKNWKLIGLIQPDDKADGLITPVGE